MDKDSNPKPTAKRKAYEDSNPLLNAAKRSKTKAGASNKRKLNGVEEIGGLRIVRAPPARPPSAPPLSQDSSRASSQLLPSSQPSQSHPPSKKFRASPMPTADDAGMDEDVRIMRSETDGLRSQSHSHSSLLAAEGLNPAFQFPAPLPPNPKQSKPKPRRTRDAHVDSILELPSVGDTPQMERNRAMRNGHPSMQVDAGGADEAESSRSRSQVIAGKKEGGGKKGHERRKSSIGNRGKRISSLFEGGIVSQPHTSVSDSSFYKHIDSDLPEPARARQLLIWCSARAAAQINANPNGNAADSPPSAEYEQVLREAMEDSIRMLVDKQIDTNVFSHPDTESSTTDVLAGLGHVKANEQNVKNRAREVTFTALIEKAKAEESAWMEVVNFYNAYQASALAEMNKRSDPSAPNTPGKNAKGKQRATPQEVEDWSNPREFELPERFRGKAGVGLAGSVLEEDSSQDAINMRLGELEFKVDSLHGYLSSALQTTDAASEDLDARFSVLSLSLASRSQIHPHSAPPQSTTSSLLSAPSSTVLPTHDPQDLLRALSRVDALRPPAQIGDAARRAVREVQRATEGGGASMADRRLTITGPPPATPRKGISTPRRGGTPGKEKER